MAEFIGRELVSVGVDEPITFENKTDTAFDVSCGIVFRKSGLYRVSIVGRRISVAVEPEPKIGRWIESTGYDDKDHFYTCSECGRNINLICGAKLEDFPYCHCGAKMMEDEE